MNVCQKLSCWETAARRSGTWWKGRYHHAAGRQGRHDPEADAGRPGNDCRNKCQIELRKQAAEALKDDYERKREIAEKKAQRLLRQEDSPAVMEAKIKDGLTFWNS